MPGIQSVVKKLPSEAEIKARLRELTDAARRLREDWREETPVNSSAKRLKSLVNDRPLRAKRNKER
jgi:hypothetical protein